MVTLQAGLQTIATVPIQWLTGIVGLIPPPKKCNEHSETDKW